MSKSLVKAVKKVCAELTLSKSSDVVRAMCIDPSRTVLIWSDMKDLKFEGSDRVTVSVERLEPFKEIKVSGLDVELVLEDGRKRKVKSQVESELLPLEDILSPKVVASVLLSPLDAAAIKEILDSYEAVSIKIGRSGASFIASDGVAVDEYTVSGQSVEQAEGETEQTFSTYTLKEVFSKQCARIKILESGVMVGECGEYSFVHAPMM
ncbi:MAG: hypothetical protein QXX12_00260 [Nanopusillaceae archaeon]